MLKLLIWFAVVMYIWFDTDAPIEYSKLLHLNWLFKHDDYRNFTLTQRTFVDYPSFLALKHKCFFTKIIACPACVSVWLNGIVWLIFYHNVSGILRLGLDIWLTLVFYHLLKLIINKANECGSG